MPLLSRISIQRNIPGVKEIPYPLNIHGIGQPRWADFPQSITFVGMEDAINFFLYKLEINNGGVEKLIPDYNIAHYVWSYDRSMIAFWGRNLTTGFEGVSIYSKDKDDLIQKKDHNLGFPYAWSPDKSYLAINGSCENPERTCSFLYNIETTPKKILNFNGTEVFTYISWSPTGDKIAFIFGDPFENKNGYGLYVMDLKTEQIYNLIDVKEEGIRISHPVWIREGEWLVYQREGPSLESQLGFVDSQRGVCQITPLSKFSFINDYDVLETDGNLFFVVLDDSQRLLTLNLKEALMPLNFEQVFSCH